MTQCIRDDRHALMEGQHLGGTLQDERETKQPSVSRATRSFVLTRREEQLEGSSKHNAKTHKTQTDNK